MNKKINVYNVNITKSKGQFSGNQRVLGVFRTKEVFTGFMFIQDTVLVQGSPGIDDGSILINL